MSFIIFLTVFLWTYLLLWRVTRRRRKIAGRVLSSAQTTVSHAPAINYRRKWRIFPIFNRLARQMLQSGSAEQLGKIQSRLVKTGTSVKMTASQWLALKLATMVLGALFGIILGLLGNKMILSIVFIIVLSLLGWIGPEFWLSRKIEQRKQIMYSQFPNVVDLLTVSVEAGLGFDQALDRVAERFQGPFSEEFRQVLSEMRMGQSRAAALQRMADRVEVRAIRFFISAVIQSERLGTGLAQVLRTQASEVRREARQAAQERAMKAPVKMLFPLVLFVFPSLFIVILGPALINIMHMFRHM